MPTFTHGDFGRPYPSAEESGDGALVHEDQEQIKFAIVDALGHGVNAAECRAQVIQYLEERWPPTPLDALQALHEAFRGGLGFGIGIAHINRSDGQGSYASIGNTVAQLKGAGKRNFISTHGVVGQNMRSPLLQPFTLEEGDWLVMHTDGIPSQWDESRISHLFSFRESPQTIAAAIVDIFGKVHDDAHCLIGYREESAP